MALSLSDEPMTEWKEIRNEKDIEALMEAFGGFHDSCIREAHLWTGHYVSEDLSMMLDSRVCVRMLVQRQFQNLSAVELLFVGVRNFHVMPPPDGYSADIDGVTLASTYGCYHFEDNNFYPGRGRDSATRIVADRVFWRDASEWMGSALRYRPREDDFLPIEDEP